MKKGKIMLSAITVLAILGGALAFKAKTFSQAYCVDITVNFPNTNGTCPFPLAGTTTLPALGVRYYYSITVDPALCLRVIRHSPVGAACSSSTTLTKE